MTTKHALKYNGAPYTAEGELQFPLDTSITRGPGHAKCSCGEVSAVSMPNGSVRRAWFKTHKATAAKVEREAAAVVAEPVADDIPLDPEPAKTVATVVDQNADGTVRVTEVANVDAEADAEPAKFTAVVPFTKDSPASFWRYLGRDIPRRFSDAGILGDVTVATNAANHTLLLSGASEADVEAARQTIETFWADVLGSVKEWKKTDPTFLARPTKGLEGRKAAYELTGEYYMRRAEDFIVEHV